MLSKRRLGDRQVEIDMPDLAAWKDRRPVLIDDIVSSGRTMIEAARRLELLGLPKPYCVVVHALFADESHAQLLGLSEAVVSTDTVTHASNAVSVVGLIEPGT